MRQLISLVGMCLFIVSCYGVESTSPDAGDEDGVGTTDTKDLNVSGYSGHACKITVDGDIYCWGKNDHGQLGNGAVSEYDFEVHVDGVLASDVSVGYQHTCALLRSGRVACWGDSTYGQAGVDGQEKVTVPTLIEGLSDIVQVVGGAYYSCALDRNGEIFCWGMANVEGEGPGYGDWDIGTTGPAPVQMPRIEGVDYIRASGHTTCAVTTGQDAVCWGGHLFPEDVDASGGHMTIRTILTDVKDLSCGNGYLCYIDGTGALKCGANNTKYTSAIVLVSDEALFEEVSCKSANGPVCARTSEGDVYCDAKPFDSGFKGLAKVDDLGSVKVIAAGNEFFCAVLEGDKTTCKYGNYTATSE